MSRLIRREQPDCIISFLESANFAATLAAMLAGALSRLTVSVHEAPENLKFRHRFAIPLFYPLPGRVVAVSQGVADVLFRRGVPRRKLAWIPNPAPTIKTQAAMKDAGPMPRPSRYILSVGTIRRTKGFDRLVAAFASVRDPGLHLVILGDGRERVARELRLQAKALGVAERVHLPGPTDNLEPWYRHAQCFVSSSRAEAWPIVLMESMAYGCPVVSFDCNYGPREIIKHGISGILVEQGNVAALATAIQQLVTSASERKRLAKAGLQAVSAFALSKVSDMWLQQFESKSPRKETSARISGGSERRGRMKMLLLTTSGQLQDNSLRDRLLAEACELTAVHLTGRQQKRLWWHLRGLDFARYDAVLANLQIKRFRRQLRFMRRIPNLFCYELDACQNYIPSSKWHGAYAEFFGRRLPSATVLCTGFNVARKLAAEGVNARYVPKGYDHERVRTLETQRERDVALGFIGRLEHPVYAERRAFLEDLRASHGLQLLRTDPGPGYVEALNRIRFFVSADIGLGEYMAKNFEAMGAGCLVCAYRQGGGEEEALGLVDMQNILLYSSKEELLGKLAALAKDPGKQAKIQQAGMAHAREHLSFAAQTKAILSCMTAQPENRQ